MRPSSCVRRPRLVALAVGSFVAGAIVNSISPFRLDSIPHIPSRMSARHSEKGVGEVKVAPVGQVPFTASTLRQQSARLGSEEFPCHQLPGADAVFVSMKTGASEAQTRLPVHFNTTFTCTPHFAIYSDLQQTIDGFQTEDVLSDITNTTWLQEPDEYTLYSELAKAQEEGRTDFEKLVADLKGDKEENPAWKLDKWKFVPMLERSAKAAPPGTKWFVYMEADTNIVWPNLYAWLEYFDASEMWYLGGQWWMNEHEFAHGGTGFILSAPAVHAAVASIQTPGQREKIDAMLHQECCGDYVVGRILNKVGLELTESWPMLQSERPNTLDYGPMDWCFPIVSQHHMQPEDIADMWDLTQDWMSHVISNWTDVEEQRSRWPLMHRNVYEWYLQGTLKGDRMGWDNLAHVDKMLSQWGVHTGDEEEEERLKKKMTKKQKVAYLSSVHCKEACQEDKHCIQYSYNIGFCGIGKSIRLGNEIMDKKEAKQWQSGWMADRIQNLVNKINKCEPQWIFGQGVSD